MINEENVSSKDVNSYSCPSCGGIMVFNPETQSMSCPYCQSKRDIKSENKTILKYDYESEMNTASKDWGDTKKVLHCSSCGGEMVIDARVTSDTCPFCETPYVLKDNTLNNCEDVIVPGSLIPFKIPQKKAIALFSKWIRKRFFAPNALKNNYTSQKMNGVYVPAWVYDSDTQSHYTAEAGEHYYVTEYEKDSNGEEHEVKVQKTRWYPVNGDYSQVYEDIIVNASKIITEKYMKKLEPFNMNDLVPYDTEYLSGFGAEKYSVGLKDGWKTCKKIIDSKLEVEIRNHIQADEVRNIDINTNYENIKYRHMLLPIWISAYKYNNKVYKYMVNGQTGEVQGEAPLSPWKIAILILIIAAIITILVILHMNGKI